MFPDAIQDCCHYNQGLACHYTAVVTEKSENKQTSFPTPPPSPKLIHTIGNPLEIPSDLVIVPCPCMTF